jgi:NitT/TauT family transport system permease protein
VNATAPSVIRRSGRLLWRASAVLLFLVVWELAPRTVVNPGYLPPFSTVVHEVVDLFVTGDIWDDLTISVERAIKGFLLAVLVGVPLGLLIGRFRRVEEALEPLVQTLRQTPVLALFPVFILIFGIGETSKTAMIFWGTVWPILLNTVSGVREVDPQLVRSARSMNVSGVALFRKVMIPASIPSIMTGIRLGATYAILMLVVAEYVGASSGLGALVINSQYAFRIPRMYAAIVIIALLGLLANLALVRLERRATRWKPR